MGLELKQLKRIVQLLEQRLKHDAINNPTSDIEDDELLEIMTILTGETGVEIVKRLDIGDHFYDESGNVIVEPDFSDVYSKEEFSVGDFVVATRYYDGDFNDPWAIGFIQDIRHDANNRNLYYVGHEDGQLIHRKGLRRCKEISAEVANQLLKTIPKSVWEGVPLNVDSVSMKQKTVWDYVHLVEQDIND